MSKPPLINGPVPPYSNVPIQPQFYAPNYFFISGITLGNTTTVTTTANMNYVINQQVRLLIPPKYGCTTLNGVTAFVVDIPTSNSVILNFNSIGASAFVNANLPNKPQIVAIGDANNGAINLGQRSQQTFIPGSFINISP